MDEPYRTDCRSLEIYNLEQSFNILDRAEKNGINSTREHAPRKNKAHKLKVGANDE